MVDKTPRILATQLNHADKSLGVGTKGPRKRIEAPGVTLHPAESGALTPPLADEDASRPLTVRLLLRGLRTRADVLRLFHALRADAATGKVDLGMAKFLQDSVCKQWAFFVQSAAMQRVDLDGHMGEVQGKVVTHEQAVAVLVSGLEKKS